MIELVLVSKWVTRFPAKPFNSFIASLAPFQLHSNRKGTMALPHSLVMYTHVPTPVNPTFFRHTKHRFFFGVLGGLSGEEAGRSESGVACTSKPTALLHTTGRGREGTVTIIRETYFTMRIDTILCC